MLARERCKRDNIRTKTHYRNLIEEEKDFQSVMGGFALL